MENKKKKANGTANCEIAEAVGIEGKGGVKKEAEELNLVEKLEAEKQATLSQLESAGINTAVIGKIQKDYEAKINKAKREYSKENTKNRVEFEAKCNGFLDTIKSSFYFLVDEKTEELQLPDEIVMFFVPLINRIQTDLENGIKICKRAVYKK